VRFNCGKRHEVIGVSIIGVHAVLKEMAAKPLRKRDWVCCDHCDREVSSLTFHRHQTYKIRKSFPRNQEDEEDSSSGSSSEEEYSIEHCTERDATSGDRSNEQGEFDSEPTDMDYDDAIADGVNIVKQPS